MSSSPSDPAVIIIASALLPLFVKELPPQMAQAWQAAWSDNQLPALKLLRQAHVAHRQTLPVHSPCTPHEAAYAQAMHWPDQQGLLPFAAECAANMGLSCPADHGWAFIDAVHWQINQGQVQLRSAGLVTPEEDQAMLQAMRPYVGEDGIHLHPVTPGRWLAHATHFKQLPSVSLNRVLEQDVAYWLDPDSVAAQSPAQRLLRRLQNEMQMLLYTHPLNDHRSVTINSFWWSGTGDLPSTAVSPRVVLNTDLQAALAAQDPQAWCALWKHMAQEVMSPGLLAGHRLVLCGEDRHITLQSPSTGLWHMLASWLPRPSLQQVLS
jgi:hypothetical protein